MSSWANSKKSYSLCYVSLEFFQKISSENRKNYLYTQTRITLRLSEERTEEAYNKIQDYFDLIGNFLPWF